MNRSDYSYFNGDLVPYGDLNLHISDLLFQRGYGVFDFFRCRNGSIPWLEDYVKRLFSSLEYSAIELDLDQEQFISLIHELQQKNRLINSAFKVIITGGYSESLESVTGRANIMVLNIPWNKPPDETFENGVQLIREEFVRPNPELKSLYYLNTLKLQKKMREYKAVDVLFHTDRISEASRANLFFIKSGRIYTPASNILKGITRKQILSLFPEIRVEDIEARFLYDFDELFLTSTSRDVTPVVSVEGQKIGKGTPGPLTREIQAAFRAEGW
ncbi:MAG: aminotransferase class IV [Bacteroidales bacterium]|nr:aminotransferase class IV [Bacteroidales bacterium]